MIFENFWPLLFLAAIPIVILLYFFKPKGTDKLISSNLLWRKSLDTNKPDSFLEKFQNNILMYLQILTVILLILALMSPFFYKESEIIGRQILLVDTSASMLQKTSNGKTRFDQGIDDVCSFIDDAEGLSLSIVTSDSSGVEIQAIDSTDKAKCKEILHSLHPSHAGGNLADAADTIDKLKTSSEDEEVGLMILSDAYGDIQSSVFNKINIDKLFLYNEPVNNISNDYTSLTIKDNGLCDVIVCCTNYSEFNTAFDVSLENAEGKLIDIKHLNATPGSQIFALFEDIKIDSHALKSTVSGITNTDDDSSSFSDSLLEDNESYVLSETSKEIDALLVSSGNTFIEKAYQAVTGESISKSETPSETNEYPLTIFDSDYYALQSDCNGNKLIFCASENSAETISNVLLTFSGSELTKGIQDFSIGVNKSETYTPPSWAHSFLEYDSKCVGYYGEHDGIREVVVGFDICESDFPLKAEFPIFISNVVSYLSDKSILANNTYYAGENLLINQWAQNDELIYNPDTNIGGLFAIENADKKEYYTVRFNTATESDGRTPEGYIASTENIDALVLSHTKHFISNSLILSAIILLIVEWIFYVKKYRYRRKFYLFARILIIALLLMAFFDIKIPIIGNHTETIFIADMSDSNKDNINAINQYINKNVDKMPRNNSFGIICLGKKAMIEQNLTNKKSFSNIMSIPDTSATDFENAIQKAISLFSDTSSKRLVILTDGKQTKGNINNLAKLLSDSDIELLSIKYKNELKNDCYIKDVIMPTYLHENENYSMTVIIDSNYDTDANLSITNPDSSDEVASSIHLNKGTNKFIFNEKVQNPDLVNLIIKVSAEDDSCEQNNTFNAYSTIESMPQILVVYNTATDLSGFKNILDSSYLNYTLVNPHSVPADIEGMLEYKGIITINTPYSSLPSGFVSNLPAYVKDYGCGYVCIGGTSSYILGGYKNTELEEILPVDMTPVNKDQQKSAGLIMVIDRSGSMCTSLDGFNDVTKLDSAINAAQIAVSTLNNNDYVGVITFDDVYNWVVNIQQNTDSVAIQNSISTINEGGGTNIFPALNEAYNQSKNLPTEQKHIILLSDGQDGNNSYQNLINSINNDNVTLSTIAIGNDADEKLLQTLANSCNGRFYSVKASNELPEIFIKEVYLGTEEIIKEGDFPLNVNTSHLITKNIFTDGWPALNGYITTSSKSTATDIITCGEKNDPILSTWQYGLGKTVAWTSGTFGEWDSSYIQNQDYLQLWKNIFDYTFNSNNLGDDTVDIVNSGDKITITYNAKEYTGETNIIANMINTNTDSETISLHPVSPGKYEAEVNADKNGLYHFYIQRSEGNNITNASIAATAVQYSDEYKYSITTSAFDNYISMNGKEIDSEYDIWQKRANLKAHTQSIVTFLLIASTMLFIVDITLRRFGITPKLPNILSIAKHKPNMSTDKGTEKHPANTMPTNTNQDSLSIDNINIVNIQNNETVNSNTFMNADNISDKKPNKKTSKKAKENTSSQVLDTSALLKKKDDRNKK